MKKRFIYLSVVLLGIAVLMTQAWIPPCPSLPTDPVNVKYTMHGPNSMFTITLWGLGSGFDITDGQYAGWCIEDNGRANFTPATLHCSYASPLPGNLGSVAWDKINYLLNHKQGTWQEVQAAIWIIVWGSSHPSYPVTPVAQAMIDDANANGGGFMPGSGQTVAILVYPGDGGIGPLGYQDVIIEISIPGEGEGCTPGYWKNHLDDWGPTGFSPTDDFDTVFNVDFFDPDITLLKAAKMGGGGVKKIARHGTAALLSAAHPAVNYPYTVAEVISIVQTGKIDELVIANELGCIIDE